MEMEKEMKKLFLIILFCLGCTGRNDPTVIKQNENTLSSSGEYVGVLPDGRKVTRYVIDTGSNHDHYLYVIENTKSSTVNSIISSGKTTRNNVNVIIDGQRYQLSPEETE